MHLIISIYHRCVYTACMIAHAQNSTNLCINSMQYPTHTATHTFSSHRFILFFFFYLAAMATTICLRTLISKSAQWVVIRLWDYPIHTEKSNRPRPNHRETHAHTQSHTLAWAWFSVCLRVWVCNREQHKAKTKTKGITVKCFHLVGCPLQTGRGAAGSVNRPSKRSRKIQGSGSLGESHLVFAPLI